MSQVPPVASSAVIRLDAATLLLQWAVGGMAFCWFTTRRRLVGLGYGWLLRGTYGLMAVGALLAGLRFGAVPVRDVAAALVAVAILVCARCLDRPEVRRGVGPGGRTRPPLRAGGRHDRDRTSRSVRRTGRFGRRPRPDATGRSSRRSSISCRSMIGAVGLVAAGIDAGGSTVVAVLRTLVGAAFLGAVTDAMLLGHWYLVQPGLPRRLLNELVTAVGWVWPFEVVVLLLPTGMFSVLDGSIDDGWNGMLGWFWVACAIGTIVLVARDPGGLEGTGVLGGDGGHRPALPGHPHRLRHRSRRPGRPGRLTRRRRPRFRRVGTQRAE